MVAGFGRYLLLNYISLFGVSPSTLISSPKNLPFMFRFVDTYYKGNIYRLRRNHFGNTFYEDHTYNEL